MNRCKDRNIFLYNLYKENKLITQQLEGRHYSSCYDISCDNCINRKYCFEPFYARSESLFKKSELEHFFDLYPEAKIVQRGEF